MADLKPQLMRNSSIGTHISVEDDDDPLSPLRTTRTTESAGFNKNSSHSRSTRPSSSGAALGGTSRASDTSRPVSSGDANKRAVNGGIASRRIQSSPELKTRPGTALGTNADYEGRGMRSSQSFDVGTRTLDYSGTRQDARYTATLGTIREGEDRNPVDNTVGVFISRGGLTRPKSACIFATSRRPDVQIGNGATVPFHYLPPELLERDPTTEVKNAPKVPFPLSTREQWQRAHMSAASTAAAGPGAYDPNINMMSTKRLFPTLSFTMSKRPGSAMTERDTGPGPYSVRYVEKHTPRLAFAASKRPDPTLISRPGPYDIQFIEKHKPYYKFSSAPGHILKPTDPATAAVPLRGGERIKKHKPVYKFSTAPRFAF